MLDVGVREIQTSIIECRLGIRASTHVRANIATIEFISSTFAFSPENMLYSLLNLSFLLFTFPFSSR